MAKRPRWPIIGVLWFDTQSTDNPDVQPIPMVSFGVLDADEPDFIRIAAEIHADGDKRDYVAIPKGAIKEIIRVGSLLEPKAFNDYRSAIDGGD